MFTKHGTLENSCKSIWIQTSLRYFGFKCAMHKHDLCAWKKCQCVCHQKVGQS